MQASKPSNPWPTEPLPTSTGCIFIVSRVGGVRRGRILGLTLCERSPENIPHLCQQDYICNRLTSQRASISLLINIKNRSIGKIILSIILAVLASLNQTNSYFSCIEAKAYKAYMPSVPIWLRSSTCLTSPTFLTWTTWLTWPTRPTRPTRPTGPTRATWLTWSKWLVCTVAQVELDERTNYQACPATGLSTSRLIY